MGEAPDLTFQYRVHGLSLSSDLSFRRINPLPSHLQSNSPDVVILENQSLDVPASGETRIDVSEGKVRIRSRFGSIAVGRTTVELCPTKRVGPQSLFSYYAVYILGFLLHHRDYLTIHASAVEVDGETIAFVGPKGTGKSTMASLFYAQGHRLISDDLIACWPYSTDASPHVDPGFPWMKLSERSLGEVLGQSGDKLERTVPDSSKRIVPIHGRQPDSSLPLRHIYVLGYHDDSYDSKEVEVKRAETKEACLVLLSNAFVQMFLEEADADPDHLDRCAALAQCVPVSVLIRPRSIGALPSVYDAVLDDLKTTRPSDSSESRLQ